MLNPFKKYRIPAGYLLAGVFILFSRPEKGSLLAGLAFVFLGILWRIWAAGHISKGKVLTTSGPYSFSRHPLYWGSFLMGVGLGTMCGRLIFPVIVIIFFSLAYLPLMMEEEKRLSEIFGEEYKNYAAAVSMFIPIPSRGIKSGSDFSWKTVFRNKEYRAWLGVLSFLLFFLIKSYISGEL